ncbi:rod shape-determining protein MreD [Sphingomonas sp. SRS2]|uniref:rod shape-determining protein MreD n=1 Tax=Sphingomonas sp. SRS2 TaxID=133190 RepID=UPI0006183FB0|nr:rod shape-determining protein MreD [Sphingomonas sp. SRS2]KKC23810.1 rod shape-determining protein MreD [Sphingomonas sp. SRS2]
MIGRRDNPYAVKPPLRTIAVPVGSILLGSVMGLVPIIATEPIIPPFGLMLLLAWRLLRPELWAAWAGLPLGLADDLISGHYLGTSMMLWTVALLVLDWVDHNLVWRDWWMEWLIAAIAITAIDIGAWALSQPLESHTRLSTLLPQLIGAILLFPIILRLIARLDRWRLKR